jgi:hypothetical protein
MHVSNQSQPQRIVMPNPNLISNSDVKAHLNGGWALLQLALAHTSLQHTDESTDEFQADFRELEDACRDARTVLDQAAKLAQDPDQLVEHYELLGHPEDFFYGELRFHMMQAIAAIKAEVKNF